MVKTASPLESHLGHGILFADDVIPPARLSCARNQILRQPKFIAIIGIQENAGDARDRTAKVVKL
jgi:hypothetical protein